jgi:hypothetical protein
MFIDRITDQILLIIIFFISFILIINRKKDKGETVELFKKSKIMEILKNKNILK